MKLNMFTNMQYLELSSYLKDWKLRGYHFHGLILFVEYGQETEQGWFSESRGRGWTARKYPADTVALSRR